MVGIRELFRGSGFAGRAHRARYRGDRVRHRHAAGKSTGLAATVSTLLTELKDGGIVLDMDTKSNGFDGCRSCCR